MQWNFAYRKKATIPGRVGIYETPNSLALAYGIAEESKPRLQTFFQAVETLSDKQALIAKFVQDHQLGGASCSYVLGAGAYSLHLVEAPLVAAAEVSRALTWVLKDVLQFPSEEAVIDTFEIPFVRARDSVKMLYAVAMQKTVPVNIEALIKSSGLVLDCIDIPELVLRNVLMRDPQKPKACVFAQLENSGGRLILCQAEQLCIGRSFELSLGDLGKNPEQDLKILEAIALEIQRSFDYLNSIFRKNIANIIVMAPTSLQDQVGLSESLKSNLGAELQFLKLSDQCTFDNPPSESDEANCLLAVGAVLREEELTL